MFLGEGNVGYHVALSLDHFEGRSWTGLHQHAHDRLRLPPISSPQQANPEKEPKYRFRRQPFSDPSGHHRRTRTATANITSVADAGSDLTIWQSSANLLWAAPYIPFTLSATFALITSPIELLQREACENSLFFRSRYS
jgi:hypothetical protein